MDQVKFGRAIGLTGQDVSIQSAVSKLEAGKANPPLSRLSRILALEKLTLSDCLTLPEKAASEQEAALLRIFKSLNPDERQRAIDMLLLAFGDRASPADKLAG